MTYSVNFTESNNPDKVPLVVFDQVLNKETSISLPGNKYIDYSPVIGENFIHLLENFARSTPPGTEYNEGMPVQGQLWYDNNNNILKLYDGTTWRDAGSVRISPTEPESSVLGELWVNTTTKRLYLYSGVSWILIGPQLLSSSSKTGLELDSIQDTTTPTPITHEIIKLYSENYLIAIISKSKFVPKIMISGFPIIYQGVTLSINDKTDAIAPIKFWGVASEADSLRINNTAIAGSKFLRNDQSNTVNAPFIINSSGGLTITDFTISSVASESKVQFLSSSPGKSMEFTLRTADNSGAISTLYLDARGFVGVNNYNPTVELDVGGDLTISGILTVSNTGTSNSISTNGGITVNKESILNGKITSSGTIIVNNKENGVPISGPIIEPGDSFSSEKYDIGSELKRFGKVYANTFYGNLEGTFIGNIEGNVTGSAGSLAQNNIIKIRGDITSDPFDILFNGVTESGEIVFTTMLTSLAISSRTATTTSITTDEILIHRVNDGLLKQSRSDFVSTIGAIPIGGVTPYLGIITTDNDVPPRFQLCDGRLISKTIFPELFLLFRYTYGGTIGTDLFGLPNLTSSFSGLPSINYIVYTGVLA